MGSDLSKTLYTRKHADLALVSGLTAATVAVMPYMSGQFLNRIVYATSAESLGIQIWVGFIASPTMRYHFNRDDLIGIQSKLFPKYALTVTGTGILALAAHYFANGLVFDGSDPKTLALTANWILNELNLLLFTPKTIEALTEEKSAKSDSSELEAAKKKFRMQHALSTLVHVASIGINLWIVALA